MNNQVNGVFKKQGELENLDLDEKILFCLKKYSQLTGNSSVSLNTLKFLLCLVSGSQVSKDKISRQLSKMLKWRDVEISCKRRITFFQIPRKSPEKSLGVER